MNALIRTGFIFLAVSVIVEVISEFPGDIWSISTGVLVAAGFITLAISNYNDS